MEKRHGELIFETDAALHKGGKRSVWHIVDTFLNIALYSWLLKKAALRTHTYLLA